MGLLSEGSPLDWEETKTYAAHVQKQGVRQFINLYNRHKNRRYDVFKWGDEIEYMLVKLDYSKKRAYSMLRATEVITLLQREETENPRGDLILINGLKTKQRSSECHAAWRPEYGNHMVESSPAKPYGNLFADFSVVEINMRLRREQVNKILDIQNGETCLSIPSFPRFGCPGFSSPRFEPNPKDGKITKSLFLPDAAIFGSHPRFKTLTRNIRLRRGEKVAINIPIFKDKHTEIPFVENFPNDPDEEHSRAAKPDHIYMDAMGFGMGDPSLQATFQAKDLDEAKRLYDQLIPLCPVMLALSAAGPIYRGLLSDIDCRWYVIAASVDCRTKEERGEEPLKKNRFRIPKSRFDSVDSYLSQANDVFNDTHLVIDQELYQEMIDGGVDTLTARHVAHLFIRDPVSLFRENIHQDEKDVDHFENINSTNWQTLRFKPPPVNSDIGWRIEFRPMDVQLTDFENAAFVVFVALLTRAILTFQLNFVIPMSKVELNMHEAQKRDAVRRGKFYFRTEVDSASSLVEDAYTEMDMDTIINGGKTSAGTDFPGLIPLVNGYVATLDDADVDTCCTISRYFKLLSDRAAGRLKTTARWIRDFVDSHPGYDHDSIISEEVNYDLCKTMADVTEGKLEGAKGLLHTTASKSLHEITETLK